MKIKQVVNIYGGPGCGKSTISSGLFYKMKSEGYNVEYVSEYARDLTYEQQFRILQEDQLYIFAEQHRRIFRIIDEVEYVITDSPLLLPFVYYEFNPKPQIYDKDAFSNLVIKTYNKYPNSNYFLIRNHKYEYQQIGRTQTLEEAKKIDSDIMRSLLEVCETIHELESNDETIEIIFNHIKENVYGF